jgi:hypothetical protein
LHAHAHDRHIKDHFSHSGGSATQNHLFDIRQTFDEIPWRIDILPSSEI